ncbi:phosphatase PAP2 family protein [Kitasatospora sp. NPDC002040]|uniref:phosphatase PAP2 family protein n=1 Tax=Kitasatospora sp. NPDC002040 TaxID=3154661 RepID=UPI003320BE63
MIPIVHETFGSGPLAYDGSGIDGGLWSTVVGWADGAPDWFDQAVRIWSDVGLAVFALFMLYGWWRARSADPVVMARVLAAPLIVVAAYLVNTVLKGLVEEVRPCQQRPGTATLEVCPAPGDWSFPSNHAVIAFATATALWFAFRALGWVCAAAALLMAASRVWVGVHYPHDVLAGALVGILVAVPLALLAARAAPLVDRGRSGPLGPFLGAGPGAPAVPVRR